MGPEALAAAAALIAMFFFAVVVMIVRCWRKVEQGTALIITGSKEPTVHFSKAIVIPLIRRAEIMDVSVKRIEIFRHGSEGLVCKDNVRADIKVAFYVRVNNNTADVLQVAQTVGAGRASELGKLNELFDAKFSEALKTVGKNFDFVELYTSRESFKDQILKVIGRDLNGYYLDDAAIDYLEQTPVDKLDPQNILDAEGIKKITDKTAAQAVLSNDITREKEKTIKKQDVEAREAILELERQLAEAEEKQHREIAIVTARERAESQKVAQEERLKAERARITTEEEIAVAEENKDRQVIVALRNKERTDQVEIERVQRDQQLESTERQRLVSLADIDKDKAIEVEKKAIQEVIRERVIVERAVVEQEEKIKDTHEVATAERAKTVAITAAEMEAQERLVKEIKAAEAARDAAKFSAEEKVVTAQANRDSAERDAAGKKLMAEGIAAEEAALGLAEATVIEKKAIAEARGTEAKADAYEKHGTAEATVVERKAVAVAKGQEAHAVAIEKEGTAEATVVELKAVAVAKGQEAMAVAIEKEGSAEASVMQQKFEAEATGISEKAKSMKLFHEAGQGHEEFKLRLVKDKDVELAAIAAQAEIAKQQADIIGNALKSAHIDIVGGETEFFDKITSAITSGKTVDRWVGNSQVLTDVKDTFFNGDPEYFQQRIGEFIGQFKLGTEDIKNLSVSALLAKMMGMTADQALLKELEKVLDMVRAAGIAEKPASIIQAAQAK
ncbi:MAG: flotillin family protein [Candidatus Nealsonbacteria bacterium]|nr:flotillin family protein [Candidatus Nealsonbacteria bacterium]